MSDVQTAGESCKEVDKETAMSNVFHEFQQELLYLEVLYTVKHKIGATTGGHTPFVNDLYAYGQQAFNVSPEDHAKLVAKAGEEKVIEL